MHPQPDYSEVSLVLIDGDSIPYILGWNHKDHDDVPFMLNAVDNFMKELLLVAFADKWIGVLSNDSDKNFRKEVYKVRRYKGDRTEKPDWYIKWSPHIEKHLEENYGFLRANETVETDDVIARLSELYPNALIASPDKDLKQLPGKHFNYKNSQFENVSVQKASYNLHTQLLMGDETDCIVGVPKLGEKTAAKLLTEVDWFEYTNHVQMQYIKYYGEHYGKIIFAETQAVVTLLTERGHPMWEQLKFDIALL